MQHVDMVREVQREILDGLPPDDPAAQRSRRDLARINALMGNWRWLARMLRQHVRPGDRVLEIGAGRGDFLEWWSRQHTDVGPRVSLTGLDLTPAPSGDGTAFAWVQQDALSFEQYFTYDIVMGNLVLHHFNDEQLATLGRRLQSGEQPRLLIACETARRRAHLWQARGLGLLGLDAVTRHDAPASVRAGFRDDELPRLLGLTEDRWSCEITSTWLGAYRLVARRKDGAA